MTQSSFYLPFLTPAQIESVAVGYLVQSHNVDTIPIPIEDIIELYEKIDVIPVNELSRGGFDAFTAKDQTQIWIDNDLFTNPNPNRLRFTLAHELAHIKLHDAFFQTANYDSLVEYKAFMESINEKQLQRMEIQADIMAGYLLVPTHHLEASYTRMLKVLDDNNIDIAELNPRTLGYIAKLIADDFQVSSGVIHRRAVNLGYWKDLPQS